MLNDRPCRLPETLSLYLDLVRFGAATVVVLSHVWPVLVPAYPLPWPGHSAVVVFFLLSGFVIAHATNRMELTFCEFANHRAARILSVSIPALILSAAVSAMVEGAAGPSEASAGANGIVDAVIRLGANALFVAQLWRIDLAPPLNSPFWSLNFEVWYYVLFGVWVFAAGPSRIVLGLAGALIAGPKIILLFPIWVLGAALYWHRPKMGERAALALFVMTGILALTMIQLDVGGAVRHWMFIRWPMTMSGLQGANQFVGDWMLAIVVALNFAAAGSLGRYAVPLSWFARPIRAAASCTFSAYLYHVPLLTLSVTVLGLGSWPTVAAICTGIAGLAKITEHQLPAARRLLRSRKADSSVAIGGSPV